MTQLSEARIRTRRVRTTQNPLGCLGCFGTTAALMGVLAVAFWAFNPDMSAREAAREGILWGGGLTIAATTLFCGVPLLLLAAAIVFAVLRRRKQLDESGPTIIDVEP